MRAWLAFSPLLLSLAAACGGIAVIDPGSGGTAGGGTGGSGGAGATGGGGSGNVGNVGGSPLVVPTIVDVKLGADCMPVVGPDPLTGSIFVDYENIGGSVGSLELASADVQFVNPMEGWSFSLSLSPTSSGPVAPGVGVEVEHVKVATPGDSSFLCNFCGVEGSVWLTYTDDQSASATFVLGCAF